MSIKSYSQCAWHDAETSLCPSSRDAHGSRCSSVHLCWFAPWCVWLSWFSCIPLYHRGWDICRPTLDFFWDLFTPPRLFPLPAGGLGNLRHPVEAGVKLMGSRTSWLPATTLGTRSISFGPTTLRTPPHRNTYRCYSSPEDWSSPLSRFRCLKALANLYSAIPDGATVATPNCWDRWNNWLHEQNCWPFPFQMVRRVG